MILTFYIVLNSFACYAFSKMKKVLHSLEILVYWMISSYIYQNFSALCTMNFKTLEVPENLIYELSHFINRIVLIPVLLITFLEYFLILNSFLKKLLLMIGFTLLFVGLEWLADFLGVLNHLNWELWWSFIYWFTVLVFLIGFMRIFRKILYKKGGHL